MLNYQSVHACMLASYSGLSIFQPLELVIASYIMQASTFYSCMHAGFNWPVCKLERDLPCQLGGLNIAN